jgi:hypothetical protein
MPIFLNVYMAADHSPLRGAYHLRFPANRKYRGATKDLQVHDFTTSLSIVSSEERLQPSSRPSFTVLLLVAFGLFDFTQGKLFRRESASTVSAFPESDPLGSMAVSAAHLPPDVIYHLTIAVYLGITAEAETRQQQLTNRPPEACASAAMAE